MCFGSVINSDRHPSRNRGSALPRQSNWMTRESVPRVAYSQTVCSDVCCGAGRMLRSRGNTFCLEWALNDGSP